MSNPFDTPVAWAQDIVAEMHAAAGITPTDEQRDKATAWLLPHCKRWGEQFNTPIPSMPSLGALLRRLTDLTRHPTNGGGPYCEWCGVPMGESHRITNDCPVALAQRVQQDMKDHHAQVS